MPPTPVSRAPETMMTESSKSTEPVDCAAAGAATMALAVLTTDAARRYLNFIERIPSSR